LEIKTTNYNIKVLLIGRATLFSHSGGDTVQLTKTAEYLNEIDHLSVDVYTVNQKIDYTIYSLIHLFNISRPSDLLGVIKKSKKPFVVSTIYVDFSEAEKNHFKWHRRFVYRVFNSNQLEYIKSLARIIKGQDKLTDFMFVLKGHKKSIQKIIKDAELLLPNSLNEYKRLAKAFGVEQKFKVIPNAIDLKIFNREITEDDTSYNKYIDAVISVGQITPVKNQMNLIKALNNSKFKVFIIGSPSYNAKDYYNKCKEIAANNICFIPRLKPIELAVIYKKARVHVLASWFETTGLVSLEAAYSGCNIVVSDRGDQFEYFKNDAFYCKPNDTTSILNAVRKSYSSDFNFELKKRIKRNLNWEVTAQKTYFAYRQIFNSDLKE